MARSDSELRHESLRSLLGLYGSVLDELIRRGVVRSRNSPVADYAEWLAAGALGLVLEVKSRKGFDASDPRTVTRHQIKGRQLSTGNRSRQLGVIRDLDAHHFDKLVALVFEPDFTLKEAYRMSHRIVKKHAKYNRHQRGHILHLDTSVISDPAVENITDQLHAYEKKVFDKEAG